MQSERERGRMIPSNAFGDENIGMGLIEYCNPRRFLVK